MTTFTKRKQLTPSIYALVIDCISFTDGAAVSVLAFDHNCRIYSSIPSKFV